MMQKQPEVGEFYTRKNGKVYEAKEVFEGCTGCSFRTKAKRCLKTLCADIIYVRRKDLESFSAKDSMDAARYRWLKSHILVDHEKEGEENCMGDNYIGFFDIFQKDSDCCATGYGCNDLDAAVDAEMNKWLK